MFDTHVGISLSLKRVVLCLVSASLFHHSNFAFQTPIKALVLEDFGENGYEPASVYEYSSKDEVAPL
jgi:hypothetical protein